MPKCDFNKVALQNSFLRVPVWKAPSEIYYQIKRPILAALFSVMLKLYFQCHI